MQHTNPRAESTSRFPRNRSTSSNLHLTTSKPGVQSGRFPGPALENVRQTKFVWRSTMKVFAVLLYALFTAFPAFAAKQYSYFRVGNPNDTSSNTTAGTVLMGGGTDVDAAFE